jgi:hypothetical protein
MHVSIRTRQRERIYADYGIRYATYRATVQIVAHHYRTCSDVDELEARRSLSVALNDLAQM